MTPREPCEITDTSAFRFVITLILRDAAYAEAAPLADGWEGRIPLHHLAPLAVHAIKFGGAYPAGLARALRALGAWNEPRSSIGVDPV